MNAGQKSARRIAASHGPLSRDTICTSCLHRLSHQSQSRRHAATAAATLTSDPPTPPPPQQPNHPIPPVTTAQKAPAAAKSYRLLASPVLSRPPLLTRELTSFEKAYYLYQKRLNERQAQPFSRYFYYQKGLPADAEWKRKLKVRQTPARDIGVYGAYGREGWDDEVLVGDETGEPGRVVDALIRDAEGKNIMDDKEAGGEGMSGEAGSGGDAATGGEGQQQQRRELQKIEVERPMPRLTEADRAGDLTSLNRKLDRSLYLLVKNKDGWWRFPEDRVYGRENLQQAAERTLLQSLGPNMNTWLVGAHPIGHYTHHHPQNAPILSKLAANKLVPTSLASRGGEEGVEREEYGDKVFFMKARIMAGQADLGGNVFGDREFRWVVREEVEGLVTRGYWRGVRGMLTER